MDDFYYKELKSRHRKAAYLLFEKDISIKIICNSLSLPEAVVLELHNEYLASKIVEAGTMPGLSKDTIAQYIKNKCLMTDKEVHQLAEQGIKKLENLLAKEAEKNND
jgi:hypothetical protein